ncbi:putative head completion protein [Serratia phage vB_SmaA_3M]|uniref:Head completion nuclease n=1 Tax=Serratia phage vB_SmaA_3M TaxID=2419930 RepID=A0A3G2YSD8_9CAUD|nr:putative head completion protein [Serratia phage vB_SmaA_3M]AYP28434.1 putative head completion protein [Serratia phage vB_SmaA_3M]
MVIEMTMYLQGRYRPVNPRKYHGDINKIVFRSSLELVAFKFCDMNPSVLSWASEETVIPYRSPVDNRMHRYFMDLAIQTRNAETGLPQTTLVEIKPRDQIKEPRRGSKKETTFRNEMMTWLVNQAKWNAARELCKSKGWTFVIWTEDHLVPGQDPEVRARFQLKSKKRRENEAEDRARKARIKQMTDQMKKEVEERRKNEPDAPQSLLP